MYKQVVIILHMEQTVEHFQTQNKENGKWQLEWQR